MDELHDPTPRSDDEATDLETRLEEIERAAPGVAPIVASAVRDPGSATVDETALTDDPMQVVVDQREAMVRAIELRDDESLPDDERARWAAAVEQLARARHEAKAELAERRLENPDEQTWMDAEFQAEVVTRDRDHDPDDLAARGAPSAPGEHSGRGEPASWQPSHDRVGPETGPETTPSNVRTTDQLTSGPGLAGGTGGQGSQNYPADTGARPTMPPLSANEDVDPPDVGHR